MTSSLRRAGSNLEIDEGKTDRGSPTESPREGRAKEDEVKFKRIRVRKTEEDCAWPKKQREGYEGKYLARCGFDQKKGKTRIHV